ncbi:MAG TPA: Crp/Fnr family transcriptional regulator [Puia sp.]|nr:Crp/Fnr family transcriptional regulator [Puia sp.]
MHQLLSTLSRFHPVPPALEAYLLTHVEYRTFPKKAVILKTGQICRYVYFIETGLVRHVVRTENAEYTPWILKEGDIATSVKSFLYQVPATDSMVTIEKTTVIMLSFDDLEAGCRLHPELAIIREKVKEKYYDRKEDRDHLMGTLSLNERYEYLLRHEPDLTVRVPIEILSSYLGMSSKKLYDIRKELSDGR